MNDKKFIQLLNLYIDGEAAPAEAVQVEHEIANDPARRRTYHDYCRIQKATRVIYDQFRTGAGSTHAQAGHSDRATSAGTGRKSGRPFLQAGLWFGGAAAACMAVAVAYWSLPQGSRTAQPGQMAGTTGVTVTTAEPFAIVSHTSGAGSSYTAPFSMQVRSDPYVRIGEQAIDPFSLSPTGRTSEFGDPALVLNGLSEFRAVQFAPAGWPVESEQNRKLQAILRGRGESQEQAQQQGHFVPVDFRTER